MNAKEGLKRWKEHAKIENGYGIEKKICCESSQCKKNFWTNKVIFYTGW